VSDTTKKKEQQKTTVPARFRVSETMVASSPPHSLPVDTTPEAEPPPFSADLIVASELEPHSLLELVRLTPTERLEIEARVAQGGMGKIDVAIDRALDRRVAMKTLHSELREDDQTVRMFLREARLTGLLDHAHIVPLYDIAEGKEGQLFFTMKLVEGKTLQDIAKALPRGVPDTATLYMLLDIVTKVCDALAFAHKKGVLHCDVKPANIMVGEFGQVFLMDWGIAKIVSTPEPEEQIIGTACYMSPEQAQGLRNSLDQRADVFLMGALLYDLLTHHPPYPTKDRLETLMMAQAGIVRSPRAVAGDGAVPAELDRIVMRALAKKPDDRYSTVSALKDDLVRFMRGGAEFPRRTFAAGETIVAEGEPGDSAFIIVEGRCDVSKEIAGTVQTFPALEAGAVFGEMAILTRGPRAATVVAAEPTTVLVVTSAVLEQELAALKPWMATLLKSLAVRFRDANIQQRATFANSPSPARIANQILMHVQTWGKDGAIAWSRLLPELEGQLGSQPIALFAAIARYGMVLDTQNDRLTIPDLDDVKSKLRADLGSLNYG
jgi:serine/threonine-protein kinase